MGIAENIAEDSPVLHHRVLACAPLHLKHEISEGLRIKRLLPDMRLLESHDSTDGPFAVIKDVDGASWVLATNVDSLDTVKYLDKLEKLKVSYYNTGKGVDPDLFPLLLEPAVDKLALAKSGVLITDHVYGSDPAIDSLIDDSTITCISGKLAVSGEEGNIEFTFNGLKQIHALEVSNDASAVFKRLERVDNLDLSTAYYFSAPLLTSLDTLKGTPASLYNNKFGPSLRSIRQPFKFETAPAMDRCVPVIPVDMVHSTALPADPSLHVSFAGTSWVAFGAGSWESPMPPSVYEVGVWDKEKGTVVPVTVLLLLETPAGDVARHIARTYAASALVDIDVSLALRSDEYGLKTRAGLREKFDSPYKAASVPALVSVSVFSLQVGMTNQQIVDCIQANPLSIAYGAGNSPVIVHHPEFQALAIAADADLRHHIEANLGSVLGIAPAQSGHASKISILTSKGVHAEVIDHYGFEKALTATGVPHFGAITELAPHPHGESLTPQSLAYHCQNKSTLLHVVLNPNPGARVGYEPLPLSDFLPEYGYLMDIPDVQGRTPLTCALRSGNMEALETLALNEVSYPDSVAEVRAAFSSALMSGNLSAVDHLATRFTHDYTVLHAAFESGFSDAASLLVAKQPTQWQQDSEALKLALNRGDTNLFNTALEHLDPKYIGFDEIGLALQSGDSEKAKTLINKSKGHEVLPEIYQKVLSKYKYTLSPDLVDTLDKKEDAISLEIWSTTRAL